MKLLFQFAKSSSKFQQLNIDKKELKEDGTEGGSFADRFYRTLYELLLKIHLSKLAKLDEYFGLVLSFDQIVGHPISAICTYHRWIFHQHRTYACTD